MPKDIKELRKKIDDIDSKIKELFLERMAISKDILEYKKENNLPILNKEREEQIREAILKDKDIIIRKFYGGVSEALMHAYRAYQIDLSNYEIIFEKTRRIAYFGKGPSNTYVALSKMLLNNGYKQVNQLTFIKQDEEVELIGAEDMQEMEQLMVRREVDQAFVPYVNSNTGVVMDTFHLMYNINFKFLKMFRDKINLYLYVSKKDLDRINDLHDIETIYSNLNAINQSSDFINKYMPFATYRKSASTSQAIDDMLNDDERISACIANSAAEDDERVVKYTPETTSNDKGSYTTFLLIEYKEDAKWRNPRKKQIEDYFIGYFLYLSVQAEDSAFSVESKSYRTVEIKRLPNGKLQMFIYTIGEKATLISHSKDVTVYVDEVRDEIVLKYEYETEKEKDRVNGTAYLRGKERDLRIRTKRINGDYAGKDNGKSGTLEYRRISKEEFDLLMRR